MYQYISDATTIDINGPCIILKSYYNVVDVKLFNSA